MSSDNGIYIGKFEDGYRVIHGQAIENCEGDDDMTDAYINIYFKDAKVLTTREEAYAEVRRLYDEIMEDDYPLLEYGISEIHFGHKFPVMTEEEVKKRLGVLW